VSVPVVPWAEVAGRIQRRVIRPPYVNPHLVMLGQTRSGKDHTIRWGILPAFPLARVVTLVTKPVVDRAKPDPTWHGWGTLLASPDELRPGFGEGPPDGTPRYLIPLVPGRTTPKQARRLLEQIAAEGEMILVIGDAARLTGSPNSGGLGQERILSLMMTEGAQLGLTIIACANSSKWAAAGIKDQAAAVLIGRSGGDMLGEFADIAQLPPAVPRSEDPHGIRKRLSTLPAHSWLYSDHVDGILRACISTPPPAGWCSEAWPPPDHLAWPTAA
jgi:hypothetical protein